MEQVYAPAERARAVKHDELAAAIARGEKYKAMAAGFKVSKAAVSA